MPVSTNLPVKAAPAPTAAAPSKTTGVFLGPGLAYEAVSQASAMVVQDAASLMRQLGTLTTAALAVITEKIVQTEGADPNWVKAFTTVTTNLTTASQAFVQVGNAAAQVMGYFQPGATVPPPPPPPTDATPAAGGAPPAPGGTGGGA
ncbi:MAG: hypothetical protein IPL61_33875 [Myxococcales bacterium]|nr:hypothetical protein [Myxococcales bacterium]